MNDRFEGNLKNWMRTASQKNFSIFYAKMSRFGKEGLYYLYLSTILSRFDYIIAALRQKIA